MSLLKRITDKLAISQKRDGGEVVSRFKGVTDFLSDALDAAKDNDVLVGIAKAVPWEPFQIVGKAAAEAVPVVKFVTTLLDNAFEIRRPRRAGLPGVYARV